MPDTLSQAFSAAACAAPLRLSDIESWHQHIPFAFALVQLHRPRHFVELGTHKGDSYLAFCQAIAAAGLSTRAFAVDTWQGDAQAGTYDDTVFAEFRTCHDASYSHFSTPLRMTFDAALTRFEDGTIDLLHIDGLHTYEAVRHDFETWQPKLASHAIVLFHDTTATGEGFGVDRFWAELAARYPAFEFPHGNGLGVLAPGSQPPQWLTDWLALDEAGRQCLRSVFARLGEHLQLTRHLGLYQHENQALWARVRQAESLGTERQARIDVLCGEMANMQDTLSWKITAPLRWLRRSLRR